MKKKILVAGGTGLVGSRLVQLIDKDKYDIYILTRSPKSDTNGVKYLKWDTDESQLNLSGLKQVYGVINLAGAGIADKRWTESRKKEIVSSRVESTELLRQAIKESDLKPEVYVGASAIGYYGERGDEILDENQNSGQGFLSEVCRVWEDAHTAFKPLTLRTSILRIGIVLSTHGGALKEIMKTTKTGVYGYFGNGSCYYSWIHIDDLCRMIIYLLENNASGIYNATAPEPQRIKTLVSMIKKLKGGFGILAPVPMVLLKLVMGEMAGMLNTSMRVIPKRFMETSFRFEHVELEKAIKHLLENEI